MHIFWYLCNHWAYCADVTDIYMFVQKKTIKISTCTFFVYLVSGFYFMSIEIDINVAGFYKRDLKQNCLLVLNKHYFKFK